MDLHIFMLSVRITQRENVTLFVPINGTESLNRHTHRP